MTLTLIIIIMTVIISIQAFSRGDMRSKLLFHPASIQNRGEYYRFLSNGFIHADYMHLFVNMFVLWQFGQFIEALFITGLYVNGQAIYPLFDAVSGRIVYLLFYLSAIVASSIPMYLRNRDNYGYAALGASGATSAVVFGAILLEPWMWFLFPPLPAILFAVGYIWYSSYMDKRGGDNIGHNQHLWGAIYGLVFIVICIALRQPELLSFIGEQLMSPQGPPF